jgi:hypothetical protein
MGVIRILAKPAKYQRPIARYDINGKRTPLDPNIGPTVNSLGRWS